MSEHRRRIIDCDYLFPRYAASYLRVAGDEAAFVEANTTHAVPLLLGALAAERMHPEQVRWVIVTHAHLDHAGGAGALLRACPRARLVAHPRAARHLVDPTRLVASATSVYGADRFAALYGEVVPIDAERVLVAGDGASVSLGNAAMRCIHTRGHANHHFVVDDPAMDAVFTGDAFGLAYPVLQRAGRFAFPSTSPTDFDAAAARASLDQVVSLGARVACLTHFGEIEDLAITAAQLRGWVDDAETWVERVARGEASEADVYRGLRARFGREAASRGLVLEDDDWSLLALDLELNAQGITYAARRQGAAT